jgi:hypothetical protein
VAAGHHTGVVPRQPPRTGAQDRPPTGDGDGLEQLDGAPGAHHLHVDLDLVDRDDAEDVEGGAGGDQPAAGRPLGHEPVHRVHEQPVERADVLLGHRPRAAGVLGGPVPTGSEALEVGRRRCGRDGEPPRD